MRLTILALTLLVAALSGSATRQQPLPHGTPPCLPGAEKTYLEPDAAGFRNALAWGKWDDGPVWDVPVDSDAEIPAAGLVALEQGCCPVDGTAIKWGQVIGAKVLREPAWGHLGAGYWGWTGLARDGPVEQEGGGHDATYTLVVDSKS